MPAQIPLPLQTVYAELVERAHLEQMAVDFDDPRGSFVKRDFDNRQYWYFRPSTVNGAPRRDRYVGPDTPKLQARIAEHRLAKDGYKQRRSMVSALTRAGMQAPDRRTGSILQALADAGVFRMRAVVVGTSAYQAYSGLLGIRLGGSNATTDDLDIAQFTTISVAINDQIDFSFLETLQKVDPEFRPISETFSRNLVCRYAVGDSYRVDLLTPNRGPDGDAPVRLPALQTDAQPLRYLDFLIYQEVQAVALYGAGVPINVPSPERYCLHKLIVSRKRIQTTGSQTKARKDLRQAGELLAVLCEQRPYEIKDLWDELKERGPKWRESAAEAVSMLDAQTGSSAIRMKLENVVGDTSPALRR